ncbi:nucleotidyltransferase [Roseburia hominis]
MKIVGLIAEYNPFHNGHQYHIEKALRLTNSDAAIVLMSGDFVQRGVPALLPKHLRAMMALRGGAGVVLELPVLSACGSAEYFARGAISIFTSLRCVSSICFGSECGDIRLLKKAAHILADEPEEFRLLLQELLKQGVSYPLARQKALLQYTKDPALSDILKEPNNILGIEYLKAIEQLHSPLEALTIQRHTSAYHDTDLSDTYSSASAIRQVLACPDYAPEWDSLIGQVPSSCHLLLRENYKCRYPIGADDFSLLLKYRLLTETAESLNLYADMTPELANRIMRNQNALITWNQFCDLLKTREVTFARISRILLHVLLGITKEEAAYYHENGYAHYARVLGFARADAAILSEIKTHAQIPLITRPSDRPLLNERGNRMLNLDLLAANLYESVVTAKYHRPFIHECVQQICIL